MSPQLAVSSIVDSIACNVCLVGEQNVTMRAGLCNKSTAELQPQFQDFELAGCGMDTKTSIM
jgi:hypothetical protein